jgi:hypothetical protein
MCLAPPPGDTPPQDGLSWRFRLAAGAGAGSARRVGRWGGGGRPGALLDPTLLPFPSRPGSGPKNYILIFGLFWGEF